MLEWTVVLITFNERLNASLIVQPSHKIAHVIFQRFNSSFHQTGWCVYIRCSVNQYNIYVFTTFMFPEKAVPSSVLMVSDIPIRFMYCSKKLFAVLSVGVSQMHAAGHLL